ncbi:MAG TPA: hypothetical protein VFW65_40250 [Pseudonocardiaceae bacterium]|nr:hypothetical protein [Pseudonocardiaceae bacterium]
MDGEIEADRAEVFDRWSANFLGGLAVVGVVAPILMVAGLADDLHNVGQFVHHHEFIGVSWSLVARDAPVWLGWAVVAGWRRTAAFLSWPAWFGLLWATAVFHVGLTGG